MQDKALGARHIVWAEEREMTDIRGLIADIGATNARFAMVKNGAIVGEEILPCADYENLGAAMAAYLQKAGAADQVKRAEIAIAGPVDGDVFRMTNHAWHFSVTETRKRLGLDHLELMNDFKAVALAVPHLAGKDVRQVGPAEAKAKTHAPIGIIGPGTGLGVASLVWGGSHYIALPGEGGHVTMPARTRREFKLFEALLDMKYHHISAERVCSGKGLVNVYEALKRVECRPDLPERTPEDISKMGLTGVCSLCEESVALFCAFLGRAAGNLALTLGAFGGIYIAGGIAGKLGEYFDRSDFRKEFGEKGRFSDYMKPIPTYLITHPFPAFVGLKAALENVGDR